MLDIMLIILAIVCMLIGIFGSVLPVLPGPGISYIGLRLLWAVSGQTIIGTTTLIVWAIVIVVLTVIDYLIPIRGTQKMGGTKGGKRGSIIGILVGLRVGPWGIIAGPFVGALIGEYIIHRDHKNALRAALGAFGGFVVGTGLKIIACAGMFWYVFVMIMEMV